LRNRGDRDCVAFLKWLFEKVRGDWTSRVLFFIIEHKATTFKELTTVTNASEQMIDYILKDMQRWGLIESKGYVKPPYIELKGRAPPGIQHHRRVLQGSRRSSAPIRGADPGL
ncbi:unnamed protein product, partial [marine sediment metagenome]